MLTSLALGNLFPNFFLRYVIAYVEGSCFLRISLNESFFKGGTSSAGTALVSQQKTLCDFEILAFGAVRRLSSKVHARTGARASRRSHVALARTAQLLVSRSFLRSNENLEARSRLNRRRFSKLDIR